MKRRWLTAQDTNADDAPTQQEFCPRFGIDSIPHLVLRNASSFRVSYFVVQEDKLMTRSVLTKTHRVMSAALSAGVSAPLVCASEGKRVTKTATHQEVVPIFLVSDYRGDPTDGKGEIVQVTTQEFPRGCESLHVFAYFQTLGGSWIRYKDKVYSIGRGNKIFTLTAVDRVLRTYLGSDQQSPTKGADETKDIKDEEEEEVPVDDVLHPVSP